LPFGEKLISLGEVLERATLEQALNGLEADATKNVELGKRGRIQRHAAGGFWAGAD
jgi:hypothetical protein